MGYDPSVTIPCQVQGVPSWADNPRYSWQFFPPALARQFEPFAFPATKSSQTFRVVVLGESAAQGIPDGAYAFARVLREMLRAAYPEVRFEVINAGMTAINSHVIYQIGKDLIRHSPGPAGRVHGQQRGDRSLWGGHGLRSLLQAPVPDPAGYRAPQDPVGSVRQPTLSRRPSEAPPVVGRHGDVPGQAGPSVGSRTSRSSTGTSERTSRTCAPQPPGQGPR